MDCMMGDDGHREHCQCGMCEDFRSLQWLSELARAQEAESPAQERCWTYDEFRQEFIRTGEEMFKEGMLASYAATYQAKAADSAVLVTQDITEYLALKEKSACNAGHSPAALTESGICRDCLPRPPARRQLFLTDTQVAVVVSLVTFIVLVVLGLLRVPPIG